MKHPFRRTDKRAIFFIYILFISLLITMFVGAAIALAPSGLARVTQDTRLISSRGAALNGLQWAQSKLRSSPGWIAQVTNNTAVTGLLVKETQGQVVGWVQEGPAWTRFRLSFNWQDGPAAVTPPTDGLNNPTNPWTDFTAPWSCNNLQSSVSKTAPVANTPSGTVVIPPNAVLLCVEGTSGPVSVDVLGNPTGFSGLTHTHVIESIVVLSGPGQAVTGAAAMSAGDLDVVLPATSGSNVTLSTSGGQTTALRTKGNLSVAGGGASNIYSALGELSAVNATNNITVNMTAASGSFTNVTEKTSDGFYQINSTQVKQPGSGALNVSAGVYVIGSGGMSYYNMTYPDYLTQKAAGSLPAPSAPAFAPPPPVATGGTPQYAVNFTTDVNIVSAGAVNDFAIVPDGGAATSAGGGVNVTTAALQAAALMGSDGWPGYLSGGGGSAGWSYGEGGYWYSVLQAMTGSAASTVTFTASSGKTLAINASGYAAAGMWSLGDELTLYQSMAQAIAANSTALTSYNNLTNIFDPAAAVSSASQVPPNPGQLTPGNIQVNLTAPGGGSLTFANNNGASGNITFGTQIVGNGAAIVSSGDINLIGTSSQLSSNPSAQLGLNIYAQGNALIDAYKLDTSGNGSFHDVSLQGVLYTWGNSTINVGNPATTTWGNFTLNGVMVAYGGNPSGTVPVYAGPNSPGKTSITANFANITFNPSYIMGLYQNLPTPLPTQILSWHED